ncbi:ATP-binding protein, partial [Patescibacteria group bacterium]|nr:ATP-binding protein [Patescibacteria group bacterium]
SMLLPAVNQMDATYTEYARATEDEKKRILTGLEDDIQRVYGQSKLDAIRTASVSDADYFQNILSYRFTSMEVTNIADNILRLSYDFAAAYGGLSDYIRSGGVEQKQEVVPQTTTDISQFPAIVNEIWNAQSGQDITKPENIDAFVELVKQSEKYKALMAGRSPTEEVQAQIDTAIQAETEKLQSPQTISSNAQTSDFVNESIVKTSFVYRVIHSLNQRVKDAYFPSNSALKKLIRTIFYKNCIGIRLIPLVFAQSNSGGSCSTPKIIDDLTKAPVQKALELLEWILQPKSAGRKLSLFEEQIYSKVRTSLAAKLIVYNDIPATETRTQEIISQLGDLSDTQKNLVRDIVQSEVVAGQRISLVRLIAAMQGTEGTAIANALQKGKEATQKILNNASPDAIIRSRQILINLSQYQFENKDSRPIIELLLNAIDTEDRYSFSTGQNIDKRVTLEINDGRAVVSDIGEGMMLEFLATLLNAGETGNLGQSGTIGKFGAGFKAIFGYLQGINDRIIFRTVNESGQANRWEFGMNADGSLWFVHSTLSEIDKARIKRGSEVEVLSDAIVKTTVITDTEHFLRAVEGAAIEIVEKGKKYRINDRQNVKLIGIVATKNLEKDAPQSAQPAVKFRIDQSAGKTKKDENTEVKIFVKGVYFDSLYIPTIGEPKIVEFDFDKHYLDYSRERKGVTPNIYTLNALEKLISTIADESPSSLLSYANILYDISNEFFRNTSPSDSGERPENPTRYLKDSVQSALLHTKAPVFPNDPLIKTALEGTKLEAYYIRSEYLPDQKASIPKQMRDPELPQIIYVPLNSNTGHPYVQVSDSKLLLVSELLRPAMEVVQKRRVLLPILESVIEADNHNIPRVLSSYISHPLRSASTGQVGETESGEDIQKMQNIAIDLFQEALIRERNTITDPEERIHADEMISELFPSYSSLDEYKKINLYILQRYSPREVLTWVQRRNDTTLKRPIDPTLPPDVRAALEEVGGDEKDKFHATREPIALFLESEASEDVKREVLIYYLFQHYNNFIKNLDKRDRIFRDWYLYASQKNLLTFYGYLDLDDVQKSVISLHSLDSLIDIDDRYKSLFVSDSSEENDWPNRHTISAIRLNLVHIMIEKRHILPSDNQAILAAYNDVDALIQGLIQGKSPADIEALLNQLHQESRRNYKELVSDFSTHGTIDVRIAPYLYKLFSDEPLLGVRETDSVVTDMRPQASISLSSILQAMMKDKSTGSVLKSITSASDLSGFMQKFLQENTSVELQSRAQAVIKEAYEQTTDQFAFLREIVTNAYEASRRTKGARSSSEVQVHTWLDEQNNMVVSLTDQGIGMDLSSVISKLLLPGVSDWESELLHFGQGFFTVFRGADEVRIRTTKKNASGKLITTSFRMTPVKSGGTLKDIEVQMMQEQTPSASVGTTIEWVKHENDPVLLASELRTKLGHYVGLFDPQKLIIRFNEKQINERIEKLSEYRKGDESVAFYSVSGEMSLNLNNVYLKPLSHDETHPIPYILMNILQEKGVVMNIDSAAATPLESRTDFVGRRETIKRMQDVIAHAGVVAAAKLFMRGDVELPNLPNDYISNAQKYLFTTPPEIHRDAQAIGRGETINSWKKYSKEDDKGENNLYLLLLNLPAYEIAGERYSFFLAITRAFSDEEFRNILPEALRQKVEEVTANAQITELQFSKAVAEQKPFRVTDGMKDADALLAWESMTRAVLDAVNRRSYSFHGRDIQFTSNPHISGIAYTHSGQSDLVWNIPAIISELHALDTILRGHRVGDQWVDRSGGTIYGSDIAAVLVRILDTTTHEDAHIRRNEDENVLTHTPEFFTYQRELLNFLLEPDNTIDLYSVLDDIQRQYHPQSDTFVLPFQLLSEGNEEVAVKKEEKNQATDWFKSKVQTYARDYLAHIDFQKAVRNIIPGGGHEPSGRDKTRIFIYQQLLTGKSKDEIKIAIEQSDTSIIAPFIHLLDNSYNERTWQILDLAYPDDGRAAELKRLIDGIFDAVYPEVYSIYQKIHVTEEGFLTETINILQGFQDPLERMRYAVGINEGMKNIKSQIQRGEYPSQRELEQRVQTNGLSHYGLIYEEPNKSATQQSLESLGVDYPRDNVRDGLYDAIIGWVLNKATEERVQAEKEIDEYLRRTLQNGNTFSYVYLKNKYTLIDAFKRDPKKNIGVIKNTIMTILERHNVVPFYTAGYTEDTRLYELYERIFTQLFDEWKNHSPVVKLFKEPLFSRIYQGLQIDDRFLFYNNDDLLLNEARESIIKGYIGPINIVQRIKMLLRIRQYQKEERTHQGGEELRVYEFSVPKLNLIQTGRNYLAEARTWLQSRWQSFKKSSVEPKCVTGETLLPIVAENDVLYKQIKDIQGGEQVLSFNEETGKIEPHTIKGLFDMGIQPVFKLTTENGKTIKTTENHPYLVQQNLLEERKIKQDSNNKKQRTNESDFTVKTHSIFWLFAENNQQQKTYQQKGKDDHRIDINLENINFLFHDNLLKRKAAINDSIANITSPVNTKVFFHPLSLEKLGTIITAPSHPADKLTNKSENIENHTLSTLINDNVTDGDYLINGKWVKVMYLKAGDAIAVQNGETIAWEKIKSIEQLPAERVYDIEVEGTHNFVANGIVAHNTMVQPEGEQPAPQTLGARLRGWWQSFRVRRIERAEQREALKLEQDRKELDRFQKLHILEYRPTPVGSMMPEVVLSQAAVGLSPEGHAAIVQMVEQAEKTVDDRYLEERIAAIAARQSKEEGGKLVSLLDLRDRLRQLRMEFGNTPEKFEAYNAQLEDAAKDYQTQFEELDIAFRRGPDRQGIAFGQRLKSRKSTESLNQLIDPYLEYLERSGLATELAEKSGLLFADYERDLPTIKLLTAVGLTFEQLRFEQDTRRQLELSRLRGIKNIVERYKASGEIYKRQRAELAALGQAWLGKYPKVLDAEVFVEALDNVRNPDVFSENYTDELLTSYFRIVRQPTKNLFIKLENWRTERRARTEARRPLKNWQNTLRRAVLTTMLISVAAPVVNEVKDLRTAVPFVAEIIPGVLQAVDFVRDLFVKEPAADQLLSSLPDNSDYRPIDEILSSAISRYEAETGQRPVWHKHPGYKELSYYQENIQENEKWQEFLSKPLVRTDGGWQLNSENGAGIEWMWQEGIGSQNGVYDTVSASRYIMGTIRDFWNPNIPSGLNHHIWLLGLSIQGDYQIDFQRDEFTRMYFADIADFVMREYQETGGPVSSEDVLVYLLNKNEGRLDYALWDYTLFLKFMTRNYDWEGQFVWMSQNS